MAHVKERESRCNKMEIVLGERELAVKEREINPGNVFLPDKLGEKEKEIQNRGAELEKLTQESLDFLRQSDLEAKRRLQALRERE